MILYILVMDSARPGNPINLLTLKEAAQYLAVSTDVLIAWNEHDILKPTITTNGEIAYTKNQLDKFKAIQNSSNLISHENPFLQNKIAQVPIVDAQEESLRNEQKLQQQNNFSQINNYHFHNHASSKEKEFKARISLKKFAFTVSFFGIAILFLVISQHSKFNSLLQQNNNKGIAYDSHSATIETTNKNTDKSTIKDNVNNSNNLAEAFDSKNNNSSTENNTDKEKLAIIQSVLGDDKNDSGIDIKSENEIVTYGQKANLRTSKENPEYAPESDTKSTVFDTEGNIKVSNQDPSEKELLATALGASGLSQSQKLVKQSSSTAGLITFAILGLLFIYFLYSSKKQLIPNSSSNNELMLQPISTSVQSQNDLDWERILEVDQKTDGSVVIIFHGEQYKVSKPELDSESDKFIERLMQLTKSGMKEIEYDALSDESIILSSPLSKIVTRLGFVGIKRDLFFPRTSKSRVLFRKYLTLDDLFSMNLTIEDLSDKFTKIN